MECKNEAYKKVYVGLIGFTWGEGKSLRQGGICKLAGRKGLHQWEKWWDGEAMMRVRGGCQGDLGGAVSILLREIVPNSYYLVYLR